MSNPYSQPPPKWVGRTPEREIQSIFFRPPRQRYRFENKRGSAQNVENGSKLQKRPRNPATEDIAQTL